MNSKISAQVLTRQISSRESEFLADSFLKNALYPDFLKYVQKGKCEENLTVSECFNTLKSFQKIKLLAMIASQWSLI